MIAFISPAKTLDFESEQTLGSLTKPYFITEAEKVNKSLKRKSRKALREMQGISVALSELNYQRNQEWDITHDTGVRPAVLAFKGDVYLGLKADQWTEKNMQIAEEKLRILSGLYGILKPSDAIMPYRLEMGTSLKVGRRENLYVFWQDKIKAYFRQNIAPSETVVNLASNEYFKAILAAKVPNSVLDIVFKDYSNGAFKVVSFFAKKARGLMADYIIQNNIEDVESLKAFDVEGYYFDESSSTSVQYVFLRDNKDKK